MQKNPITCINSKSTTSKSIRVLAKMSFGINPEKHHNFEIHNTASVVSQALSSNENHLKCQGNTGNILNITLKVSTVVAHMRACYPAFSKCISPALTDHWHNVVVLLHNLMLDSTVQNLKSLPRSVPSCVSATDFTSVFQDFCIINNILGFL